jgi:hypothetical protein
MNHWRRFTRFASDVNTGSGDLSRRYRRHDRHLVHGRGWWGRSRHIVLLLLVLFIIILLAGGLRVDEGEALLVELMV